MTVNRQYCLNFQALLGCVPLPVLEISWKRLGLLRLSLGACGIVAGLSLGAVFVTVWHWAALFVFFMFGWRSYGWVYVWDLIFISFLIWEGYRYKARMPPHSPFTNAQALLTKAVIGVAPFTPQQAAYSISEILYVAPRLFFGGIAQLRRIAWPSGEMSEKVQQIHNALLQARAWVQFEELQGIAGSQEQAAVAVAMLTKAGLATGRYRDGVLSFRSSELEWI